MRQPVTCWSMLAACFAAFLLARAANADTVISAFPYTISAPGTYVLEADLAFPETSGYAVIVNASDVVLDLKGRIISGAHSGLSRAVFANNRSNVTIRNGTIEGFRRPVFLDGAGGASNANHVVENLRINLARVSAIYVNNGRTLRIEGCQIQTVNEANPVAGRVGMELHRTSAVLRRNQITLQPPSPTTPPSGTGIYCGGGNYFIVGNQIDNTGVGVAGNLSAIVKYQANLTSNVTTPLQNGVDAGRNN